MQLEEKRIPYKVDAVWKSTSVRCTRNFISHFSAMTRLSWLGRASGENRHRHAIEQASRRWRGGRATAMNSAP